MNVVPIQKSNLKGQKGPRASANARGIRREKTVKLSSRTRANEKLALVDRIVAHVNRKRWWHVPPRDPGAYQKRGKFLASSYREAEFWGRPLDKPQRVWIAQPLIGDEATIEKKLFGKRISDENIEMEVRFKLDTKIKRAALAKGYDSIVLLAPKAYAELKRGRKMPRSIELNVFRVS